ncbi:hypothetical protein NI17_014075 [Thermobifida halotolerans]|uniref:Uncharacterized protein n=1 Tax=Thermobifida halotolerans TaxID=483545 RepID=A0A399G3Z3_9ACTN|nr:hypothetical protein [Thermobifida halotolerans]UOE17986.1 hypothetical protein NI17_014075 [Thermobifida halotolerans]
MRKPHNRWTVLAGAAAVSLAAFGFPALAAADGDAAPASQTVHQKSTYLVDGYRVGYLPPGLSNYGSSTETSTDGEGNRTSYVMWSRGETVHGKVGVRRRAAAFTLDEVRDQHHGHLDSRTLRRVTVNGSPGYLSRTAGEVFWVDREGAALSVFLEPSRWSPTELMKMAEGVTPHAESASSFSVTHEGDGSALGLMRNLVGEGGERSWLMAPFGDPATEQTDSAESAQQDEEQPRLLPAPADAPSSPSSDSTEDGETGGPTDEQATEVMVCLTEEADMPREEVPTEGGVTTPWGGANWNSGLWELVPLPTREAAVVECARRTGLEQAEVQEVADSLGSERSASDSDSSEEDTDRSSQDSESVEQSEDSQQKSPWDLLPWL